MEEFFSDYLYRIVSWLYSVDLDDYLSGFETATNSYYNFHEVSYPMLGGISMGISLVAAAIYYYGINRASFNKWYHWGLVGLIAGAVNDLVGFFLCNDALMSGYIDNAIQHEDHNADVDAWSCAMLGMGNMIIAVLLYFLFSMMLKWWSTNCKRTPF